MSKFKVGQKVEVVSCHKNYDSYIGYTGVIEEVTEHHDIWCDYYVELGNVISALPFFEDELEAIDA